MAAVAEREQIAFAKCDAVTATGSKRRRRLGNFPARSFSDNSIFFMEKYSSGRRGVTRKQTDFVTVYFPKPLQHLAFTELKRRDAKRLVCSFLSKFRQPNNTEKYSSGDVCERCRWQSKRAIRSGSRRRARANEFAKCDAVTATGSKRRRRLPNLPARAFLTI